MSEQASQAEDFGVMGGGPAEPTRAWPSPHARFAAQPQPGYDLEYELYPPPPSRLGQAWRFVIFLWKWFIGAAACMSLLSAVLVVGWTYRLMHRCALKTWSRANPDAAIELGHWPNWILKQESPRTLRNFAQSLWLNAKIGVQGVFNTWVLTLLPCIVILFSWRFGWDNSFNKVYEQAYIGPLVGLLGIGAFIAVMLYVPLAQARQAISGDWRAFYHFRLVWRLVRSRWGACAGLAALYALVGLPVMVLQIVPQFLDRRPVFEQMSEAQLLNYLNGYYFWASVYMFAAFVVVRVIAARIYARTLLAAVRRGQITPQQLGRAEHDVLSRLGLFEPMPRPRRHPVLLAAWWTGSRLARTGAIAAVVILWFAFTFQSYLGAFLHYRPITFSNPTGHWLNQPLVQLPVVRYIPPHLLDESP